MTHNQMLLNRLEQLLKHKKSKSYYAEKLNISELEVEELLKELRDIDNKQQTLDTLTVTDPILIEDVSSKTKKVNNEKGTLESVVTSDFEPKNDKELAVLHKVDLDVYTIVNYWSKILPNGKFTSSLFCKKKTTQDYTIEDFSKFLNNYIPKYIKVYETSKSLYKKQSIDLEISIADFHLAKQTLEGESILDKKSQFLSVVQELVEQTRNVYNINKIVFPISNDFFHTDNYQNQTTNGTPQDVLTSYHNEYEEGFDLLVTAINYLQSVSEKVEVILVQGNHDRTKSFYLAHALDVFFRTTDKIFFQREHSTTKCIVLGNTFIGYHHGNCKIEDLPLLFATGKDSEKFGKAIYREIHTGDKHHYMAKEIKGVRIQQMPSLSGTDRWHADNNYVHNIRAGIAIIYHPVKGKICEFESRI